jgi:hypothetical protein
LWKGDSLAGDDRGAVPGGSPVAQGHAVDARSTAACK